MVCLFVGFWVCWVFLFRFWGFFGFFLSLLALGNWNSPINERVILDGKRYNKLSLSLIKLSFGCLEKRDAVLSTEVDVTHIGYPSLAGAARPGCSKTRHNSCCFLPSLWCARGHEEQLSWLQRVKRTKTHPLEVCLISSAVQRTSCFSLRFSN